MERLPGDSGDGWRVDWFTLGCVAQALFVGCGLATVLLTWGTGGEWGMLAYLALIAVLSLAALWARGRAKPADPEHPLLRDRVAIFVAGGAALAGNAATDQDFGLPIVTFGLLFACVGVAVARPGAERWEAGRMGIGIVLGLLAIGLVRGRLDLPWWQEVPAAFAAMGVVVLAVLRTSDAARRLLVRGAEDQAQG